MRLSYGDREGHKCKILLMVRRSNEDDSSEMSMPQKETDCNEQLRSSNGSLVDVDDMLDSDGRLIRYTIDNRWFWTIETTDSFWETIDSSSIVTGESINLFTKICYNLNKIGSN